MNDIQINISGNAEEVKKLLGNFRLNDNLKQSSDFDYVERIKSLDHWSYSKNEWVPIEEMDIRYIINIIRQMSREQDACDLVCDDEFKSLVLNLADKFREELIQDEIARKHFPRLPHGIG